MGIVPPEKIFWSFGRFLFKIGISPNIATLISSLFTFLAISYFFKGQLLLGGIMLLLDYFFDMMDGIIARAVKKENDKEII